MPMISFIQRMEHIDLLIYSKATGTPAEFAAKLRLSKRSLYLWPDQLKNDFGFPIEYDNSRKTYHYTEQGRFAFGFRRAKQGAEKIFRKKIAGAMTLHRRGVRLGCLNQSQT